MEAIAAHSKPKTTPKPRLLTFEEYLEKEEKSLNKHEFQNGKRIPMAGATNNHNLISLDILTILNNFYSDENPIAIVYPSDMKIFIPAYQKGVYPDASVLLGEPEFYRGRDSVYLNPTLVVEVLSDKTENYDRTEKFHAYQTIPSLQEYVLVNQYRPEIEVFFRQNEAENQWLLSRATGLDASIFLQSLGCSLALKAVYRRIKNF